MAFFCLFSPLSPLFFVLPLFPSSHICSALFCPFLHFFYPPPSPRSCFVILRRASAHRRICFPPVSFLALARPFPARTPPLHCFRPALPTPTLGRPPHTHPADARSPCVLAPACYICTPSPKKRFFEGISALFLSEIPLIIVVPTSLQNIYFYKYILSCNNYLYARKHCTPWRGFSRGWRGIFARALFQGSARAPKRLFVGVFSAPEWPE